MSKKWKEIWFISAISLIASILFFKYDPGFAGYLLGIAIMFPSLVWYFDNQ